MSEVIRCAFAGDFCYAGETDLCLSEELNHILEACDVRVLNFEGPLKGVRIRSANGTVLNQSDKSPQWCQEHGFNVITLANNHAFDWGEEGLRKTAEAFNGKALAVGAGVWEDAYKARFMEIKGRRVGFYSVTSGDFASLKDRYTDASVFGCPWMLHPDTRRAIREAKAACDYLIVFPHAGIEFMNYPLPELRTVYQEFVDLGADAVIASHPHVPQGWETYKGRPIYYSLGNFFFDKMKGPVSFVFNGLVAVIEFSEAGISLRTVVTKRVENRVELENDKEVIAQVEGFAETLKDDRAYMEKVNEGVARLHGKYEGWMLGGLNAIKLRPSLKMAYHAFRKLFGKQRPEVTMHQIREDSTRWLLQREYKRGGGVQL